MTSLPPDFFHDVVDHLDFRVYDIVVIGRKRRLLGIVDEIRIGMSLETSRIYVRLLDRENRPLRFPARVVLPASPEEKTAALLILDKR